MRGRPIRVSRVGTRETDRRRESAFLGESIDPITREVLDTEGPWDAYDAATQSRARWSSRCRGCRTAGAFTSHGRN